MSRVRTRLIAVVAVAATLLAGCTSSKSPSGGSHTTGAAASSVDATSFAATLDAALNALTSAHLDVDAGALGGTSTADVALKDGHATASDVHLTESGQQVELVTVGGTSWAKLPGNSAKPWHVVSANSTDAVVRSLATGVNVASVASSLSVIAGFVRSSTGLTDLGPQQVDGVATTHYTMRLDPTKKTGNAQLDGLLSSLGSTKIPVDLWLDAQHRPVKFVIHVSLAGTGFPVTVHVSKLDAPVSITAPPASQVGG